MAKLTRDEFISSLKEMSILEIKELVDYVVEFDIDGKFDNILLGFDYIILAQTVAVLKSLAMGKTPDNHCPTGEVNRVVKGVTLYPYSKGE